MHAADHASQQTAPAAPPAAAADSQATRELAGPAGPIGPAAAEPIACRWALLVGVNEYEENTFSPLKFCVNDVLSLERMLQVLGYTVVSLHDSAAEGRLRPRLNNVTAELARMCEIARPNDLIFVHFACHGHLLEGQPVLILQDSRRPILDKNVLPLSSVQKMMQSSKARRLILTLDACHTGVEARALSDPDQQEFIRNTYELASGFALIAGSTAQQVAQEWHAKQHGVFTYYMLDGLSGRADRANKGFVTVDDLKAHVLDAVRRWDIEQGRLLQEPTARTEGIGDMIVADHRQPKVYQPQSNGAIPDSAATPRASQTFPVGRPVLQPDSFFGREREVKRLFTLLRNPPLQNAAIIGPRHAGKTSLLNYLAHVSTSRPDELRPDQQADYLPDPRTYRFIVVDFQDPRLGSQKGLLRYLLTALDIVAPDPCPMDLFMDLIAPRLDRPTVVLLDEVGVALERYKELDDTFFEGLRFLANKYSALAFVMTSHKSPVDLAHGTGHSSPFFNIFGYSATLGPLNEKEARALINSSPRPFSPADVDWILATSGCWPVCLQVLCRQRLLEEEDTDEGWKADGLRQLAPYKYLLTS